MNEDRVIKRRKKQPGLSGRPTDLTDELLKKIRECIVNGNNLKETATFIFNNYPKISEQEKERGLDNYIQKLYNWKCDNYLSLANLLDGWKRDRKLMLAEKKLEDILDFNVSDKETLKTQAKVAMFTAETLGKDNYGKNIDLTTKGKEIPQPIYGGASKE